MTEQQSMRMMAELRCFARFTSAEQRYIRKSLEVAAMGAEVPDNHLRGILEAADVGRQVRLYAALDEMRRLVPDDVDPVSGSMLVASLIPMSAFDLSHGKITSFAAYRFLYERLIGAKVRPWLVSAFCAAAGLPSIHPDLRHELLSSLSGAEIGAVGWSIHEPAFLPQWVDKVPVALCY